MMGLIGWGNTKSGGVTCDPGGGRWTGGRPGVPGRDGSAITGVGVPGAAGVWPGIGGRGREVVSGIGTGGFG